MPSIKALLVFGWSEWVIKFNGPFRTAYNEVDIVHTVHITRAIITYTLASLSSFTQTTRNQQATSFLRKKENKKETQNVKASIKVDTSLGKVTLNQFTMDLKLNEIPNTQIESQVAIM